MTHYALTDIRSYCNTNRIYAYRGEQVTVYNKEYEPIWCCSRANGEQFSCHRDKLSESKPEEVTPIEIPKFDLFNQV